MDGSQEREDEIVALESIYETRMSILRHLGLQQFEVSLEGHEVGVSSKGVSLTIFFEYTPKYPHEGPLFRISKHENLTEDELLEISALISTTIDRSLGYIMIFDVLSEVQENLNSICETRTQHQKNIEEQRKRAAELEEETKFLGERVTIESFVAWHNDFVREMEAKECKVVVDAGQKRLTGRELFLQDARYDDSDLTFYDGEGCVDIDENLFANLDDLDLNDVSVPVK